jgi:signal transduction histidine kinase/DNA-binding response OmpR family regulator/ligand-binding sensor domain-containing protein
MSSQYVSDICQDRTGYIWINTDNGLNRYDGYNFTSYKYPKKSKPIALMAGTIKEDKQGNIWITSYNGGIEKFNPQTQTFKNYLPDSQHPAHGWGNYVLEIYFDKDNIMWIGTAYGFYRFNEATDSFTQFLHNENDPNSLGHNSVNGIYEDRSGTLWLATGGGLEKFDRETNRFFHYWHYPNNEWGNTKTRMHWLQQIIEDEDGVLWMGSDGGLVKFDKKTEKFNLYSHNPDNSVGQARNTITSLFDDGSGNIWLGNWGGLDIFNKKANAFTHYSHDENDPKSLSSNDISSIMVDNEGSLWIGTFSKGVNKLDYPNPPIKKYLFNTSGKVNSSPEVVFDLFKDSKGIIWVATNKGLSIFNPQNETITYKYFFTKSGMVHDKAGNFLVTTGIGGLYKIDKDNHWTCYVDSTTATYSEFFRSLYQVSNNDFLLGTINGNLYSFSSLTKKLKLIVNVVIDIWTIYEDSQGLVWFGGNSSGLFCYDSQKNSTIEYDSVPEDSSTIIDNSFFSAYEDKKGTLWFGCGAGLVRFNRSKNNFKRFYGNNEFLTEWVRQILEDDRGNLWMSTGKGITKFNPVTGKFKDYYSASYFPEIKFNLTYPCKAENGEMYFGGENGFVRFHPDSIKDDTFIPPIVITSFRKFEKPFPFGKEIELSHSDNFLSFEFATLSYINRADNQYAYKMEGVDKDWVYCGTRRYASYPNLEPGDYVFRVKGSTSNRVWNEAGTSIKIIILPPWWKTWWAYILYSVFLISIFMLSSRIYLNRQKLKQKLVLESEHTEKLEEIARLKSNFFTNISHEFRTPLTLILGPVKQIIERIKDEKTKDELSIVHKNANKLIGLVNQLLDISKLESGNMKLQTTLQNIVPFLKALLLSFTSYAERKRITLKFNSTHDEIIIYLDKDKAEKIITNILSNAFKFTPEGGRIEINVDLKLSSFPPLVKPASLVSWGELKRDAVEISISDTGVGIPQKKISKIFDRFYQVDGSHTREQEGTGIGLSLTKELVELHRGKIEVESEEGKGTTVIVSLPLGKEHLKPDEIYQEEYDEAYEQEKEKLLYGTVEFAEGKERQASNFESFPKESKPILLIVEDNSDVRNYIKDNLKKEYFTVEAVDGEDGWNKSIEQIPDLIISDVMMPKMDGFQLCNKLKTDERTSHIPVIMLTAKAAKQDKIEGYETGADDYIMKPFEPDELRARIKNLIEQRKRLHAYFQKKGIIELNQTNITSVDKKFLQKAFEIITQNISDASFTIETFAENLYVSKSLLRKKIVSLTGEPPVELVKRIRLKKAAELIEKNFGNLSEIALEVGFNNPAYFSECFKKQFGVSPSQYQPKKFNN